MDAQGEENLAGNKNVADTEVSLPRVSLFEFNLGDHCAIPDPLSPPHMSATESALGEEGRAGERHSPRGRSSYQVSGTSALGQTQRRPRKGRTNLTAPLAPRRCPRPPHAKEGSWGWALAAFALQVRGCVPPLNKSRRLSRWRPQPKFYCQEERQTCTGPLG